MTAVMAKAPLTEGAAPGMAIIMVHDHEVVYRQGLGRRKVGAAGA